MLSNGDREVPREIDYKVRHGPRHLDEWGEIPAVIAWPNAVFFSGMAYLLREHHVLLWGGPLFVAGLFLAWHALWRDNGSYDSKALNVVFLVVYSTLFEEVFRGLWGRGHHFLAGLICLTGLVAINALLGTLLRRSLFARFRSTHR